MNTISAEQQRINANQLKEIPLEQWGPYLSERQWGTVREDYSADGDAWRYFTHEQSRSRVYRWGEDGIAGICDLHQNLCFAITLWNGQDHILKERLFGLSNQEGNHGEDVKELYYYLDNIPTHYYMQYLYKYPQAAFPYQQLIDVNQQLSKQDPEFELLDTGIFNENKYFDVLITYAKINSEDICIEIKITNQSDQEATITVLPTVWFRNRWQFNDVSKKPVLERMESIGDSTSIKATHDRLGEYYFYHASSDEGLMTENETNTEKIFGSPNHSIFLKDSFHDAIAHSDEHLLTQLKQKKTGSKYSSIHPTTIPPHQSQSIYLRLTKNETKQPFDQSFKSIFNQRKTEADEFYYNIYPDHTEPDDALILRQAFAGLLWNKQFYQYDIERWLAGDAHSPAPPIERNEGRNSTWEHLKIADVLSMPDKWEYPWFAAWDLCFHCVTFAYIDPSFAKNQLLLLCREWYMSPTGQIPAYEWDFSNVNPPVHAWAAFQTYKIEKQQSGKGDLLFLKKIFQKLMIHFTWWANREDSNENNIFAGGFLGLDNIGVIDRNSVPTGTSIEQVDATAWMGMFALNMMDIALEISQTDPSYEDVVTKFYEHFILIVNSLNDTLWDPDDNFFYDRLHTADGHIHELKVRSIVGLSVLFDVSIIRNESIAHLPDFRKRMDYLKNYHLNHHRYLPASIINAKGDILVSLISKDRLIKLISILMDESEFLSTGGIRALSKYYHYYPYSLYFNDSRYSISYLPAESDNGMFGGNSNWRGPVWMPMNYLIIQTLHQLNECYPEKMELTADQEMKGQFTFKQMADNLSDRIRSTFKSDHVKNRIVHGRHNWFYSKPENQNLILFYEYYNGDTAEGVGASHQTGWSSLVAALMMK